MRRMGVCIVLGSLLIVLVASPVWAANPHFSRASASGPDTVGALRVSFKLVGLGGATTTSVVAVADATTVYGCQASDGSFPAPVVSSTQSAAGFGQFTASSGGQITGSLILSPPAASVECAAEETLVLVAISYTHVQLSEPAAGTVDIAGTFTRTFVAF